ncbi:MAG: Trk family potassium uptake protein [Anaerofustis stercorihominis]|nr:Trk family potassium uptake protein [Anaerofustis stercorihominis]
MINRQKIRKISHSQILALGFLTVILIGTVLLMLPISSAAGEFTDFISCLFTATSATCVTGLTVLDTGTYWSVFGQIVIIVLIQIGGLGFMSLTTILLLALGKKISIKNKMLISSSLSLDTPEGIIKYVKRVVMFTFIVEGIGALLLFGRFVQDYPLLKAIYFSVFHSISAFCNAGFDLIGNGVGFMGYTASPILNITICLLIVIGGIGFTVAMDVLNTKKLSRLQFNSKIVLTTTAVLLISGFVVIFIAEYNNPATMANMSFGEKILTSLFACVTPRTAGFFTINYAEVTSVTYLMTVILMFIGGSPGSTAGGIKTSCIAILTVAMYRTIKGQGDMNVFGRRITEAQLRKAVVMSFMPLLWTIFVIFLLCATQNIAIADLIFETVSAIATVGLTTGITASLNNFGRVLITITMFFGRVGIMTIAYAVTQKREDVNTESSPFRFPEGNIML